MIRSLSVVDVGHYTHSSPSSTVFMSLLLVLLLTRRIDACNNSINTRPTSQTQTACGECGLTAYRYMYDHLTPYKKYKAISAQCWHIVRPSVLWTFTFWAENWHTDKFWLVAIWVLKLQARAKRTDRQTDGQTSNIRNAAAQ